MSPREPGTEAGRQLIEHATDENDTLTLVERILAIEDEAAGDLSKLAAEIARDWNGRCEDRLARAAADAERRIGQLREALNEISGSWPRENEPAEEFARRLQARADRVLRAAPTTAEPREWTDEEHVAARHRFVNDADGGHWECAAEPSPGAGLDARCRSVSVAGSPCVRPDRHPGPCRWGSDDAPLSCLGCGQIGTPSTIDKPSGVYLCAERCVPAIRATPGEPPVQPTDPDHPYWRVGFDSPCCDRPLSDHPGATGYPVPAQPAPPPLDVIRDLVTETLRLRPIWRAGNRAAMDEQLSDVEELARRLLRAAPGEPDRIEWTMGSSSANVGRAAPGEGSGT